AEAILKAKVYKCSLEQLLPLKGLRTEIIRSTRQRRKTSQPNLNSKDSHENREAQLVTPSEKIRQVPKGQQNYSNGAARVEAIVNGTIAVNAIIDPGSHTTFISQKLAEDLNLHVWPIRDDTPSNRLADGSSVKAVGEVDGLVIQIQDVLIRIPVLVFPSPPVSLTLRNGQHKVVRNYG
ncbi:MAG: hypothetical protein EXX96DRAFT_654492, partial [Benjaminiella poitrasii]